MKAGTITTTSKPEQQEAGVDIGKVPATTTAAARSAEDIIPKAAHAPAVQQEPGSAEAIPQSDPSPASPAPVAKGAEAIGEEGKREGAKPWPENLRTARERMKRSRPEIAKSIRNKGVQITADAIKKHEEGNAMPRASVRSAYAAVYQVPEETLFPPKDQIIPR